MDDPQLHHGLNGGNTCNDADDSDVILVVCKWVAHAELHGSGQLYDRSNMLHLTVRVQVWVNLASSFNTSEELGHAYPRIFRTDITHDQASQLQRLVKE